MLEDGREKICSVLANRELTDALKAFTVLREAEKQAEMEAKKAAKPIEEVQRKVAIDLKSMALKTKRVPAKKEHLPLEQLMGKK